LLRDAGTWPTLLQSSNGRVTTQSFSKQWLGLANMLDDELRGQDSRRMKVGSYAVHCRTLVQYETLENALLCMARFFNLLLDDFDCRLESDVRHGHLTIRENIVTGAPRVFGHEILLMMQHGVAC
jgi:hypothetical protein